MLIGFNNIHFSWKETILLIEERRERERREGARRRGGGGGRGEKKKAWASFHFQVRPWDDAFEKALYRFRANEIKWCRPWQKGKPKLKAIYFHWGMWHCSGTINGLSIDTEIWGERTKKKRQRYKEMSGATDESRERESLDQGRLTLMIYIIVFLLLFLHFLQSLNRK